MTGVIAISGATGQIGGRVAQRLAHHELPSRLIVRNPGKLRDPGVEVALGDFNHPDTLEQALVGVDTFFFVSAPESKDRADVQRRVVDAAAQAGVRRIVYVSFVSAAPDCTFTFGRDHWHTEQAIRASGLDFTFLRDNLYQDVIPLFAGDDGVIRGPAADGKVGAVTRDDVADAAAAVLTTHGHDGQTYDLTGPRAFTFTEAAAMMTEVLGRPITYHAETLDEAYQSRESYGAAQWELDGWVTSYEAAATGELDVVTDSVPALTGHPATDFRDYLATRTT
ncbi:SDR family oxidoreductase [Hoyosella rhizosphaerae]|uniref:NAD(P)-dependent oxidoreductase n=1 Tax=Hoyosella rhizosphaerae TaxID=1755582 RepID=A0A916XD52_9ACTN|nr:SDR family oxidoreductase [Hoyosella rhizosphaerae]MBN4927613.1 SDR family oxidoreductase [Hoyosella rhizosphaerae]GGC63084.1 NAD(P)-dependent oxidoreductase [Hoyosella rhizosphaerae]